MQESTCLTDHSPDNVLFHQRVATESIIVVEAYRICKLKDLKEQPYRHGDHRGKCFVCRAINTSEGALPAAYSMRVEEVTDLKIQLTCFMYTPTVSIQLLLTMFPSGYWAAADVPLFNGVEPTEPHVRPTQKGTPTQ